MKKIASLSALLLAGISLVAGATAAQASASIGVDLPNDPVAPSTTVDVPVSLSGVSWSDVSVAITPDSGTVTLDDANSTLTLNPGYSSLVDQAALSFHGSVADVTAALATGLHWTTPSGGFPYTLQLKLVVREFVTGETIDPATGHTYKFVTTPAIWVDAENAAEALVVDGQHGYLASIGSASENDFIANKTGAADVWIGGTDKLPLVTQILTKAGKTTPTWDTQTSGDFVWVGGSDAGTNFSHLLSNPVAVNGKFVSWASGEPNNGGAGEDCAVTNWDGAPGMWNDLDCARSQSYLVEFDTDATAANSQALVFNNVDGTSVDSNPAPVVEPLAHTGFDYSVFALIAGITLALGAGLMTASRRKN